MKSRTKGKLHVYYMLEESIKRFKCITLSLFLNALRAESNEFLYNKPTVGRSQANFAGHRKILLYKYSILLDH